MGAPDTNGVHALSLAHFLGHHQVLRRNIRDRAGEGLPLRGTGMQMIIVDTQRSATKVNSLGPLEHKEYLRHLVRAEKSFPPSSQENLSPSESWGEAKDAHFCKRGRILS